MRLVLALLLLTPSLTAQAPAAPAMEHHEHSPAVRSLVLTVSAAGQKLSFTAAELAALPQASVTVRNGHTQASETYTGVAVGTLLERAGLSTATAAGSKLVYRSYVLARGTDDYTVLFSAAELEPALRLEPALVALTLDGKPLAEDGAFKLIQPGEKKPARWVRNLAALNVTTLP